MDVCDGGTISGGSSSITFTNSHTTQFTINTPTNVNTGTDMPGWPATAPVVPAAHNGTAGSKVVQLSVNAQSNNTYEYTTTPACPQGTNPRIVVS